jgi:acyl-CoA synthetase (AMP-forming)/AMP-acid ligase II
MTAISGCSNVELSDLPLSSYVLEHAWWWSDRIALIDGLNGVSLSYAELAAAVSRAAAGLAAHGVTKGDVVMLYSPNGPDFVIAYHASLTAGAVITPINAMASGAELSWQLRHSGARWMITTAELFERSARRAATETGVREVFVFGDAEGATPFARLLGEDRPAPGIEISADDIALLPYSSGTIAKPKGVVLSHRSLVASLSQARLVQLVRSTDVLIAALPLSHMYGMQVTMNLGLHEGATIVTMPRFDLSTFLRVVQDHQITRAEVVPPIVLELARSPIVDDYDLSSLQIITSAAAPLSAGLARSVSDRLGCRVKQGYGMTELGGPTHVATDTGRDDPASIGPALPGVQCRVVDTATGVDLELGEWGELLIRSPGVMQGYLNNPQATAEAIDPDGWLHTGDIALRDVEGWFRVVDRCDELIRYNGYQVVPAEIEGVLLGHPAVADAAVVGSPDERAGEIPKAFVVLCSPASADELQRFVADRVSPYKKIRILEFVEALPRLSCGKLLRRVLAERDRGVLGGV